MARLLHVSDVHCNTGALKELIGKEAYDVLIVSGDLECLEAVDVINEAKNVVAVTGNLDDISIRRALDSRGMLVDGRVIEVAGVRFAGVGGIDPLSDIKALHSVQPSLIEVLITHYPPRGVLDRTYMGVRIGLREVRDLALRLRPRLHLFGHVHEDRGLDEYEGIVAVNAGPLARGYYAVIGYGTGSRPQVELRRLG